VKPRIFLNTPSSTQMGQNTLKALARAHSMKSSVCGEEECTRTCTRVRTHAQIKVDLVKQTSFTLETDWQQANSAARSRYAVLREANFTFETQETSYFSKTKVICGLTVRLKYKNNHAFEEKAKLIR
jgi:hypothetical protein